MYFKTFLNEVANFTEDSTNITYNGSKLISGKPTTIHHIKNKQKAPNFGSRYGQDIEPDGYYVTHIDSPEHRLAKEDPKNYEVGTIHSKNPLVIISSSDDPTVGWKRKLPISYGGKKKKALSLAIVDGYDGIITVTKYGPSETISLQSFL